MQQTGPMTRREIILRCILTSLRKRLWLLTVVPVSVGMTALLLDLPLLTDFGLGLLAALCAAGRIARSSYLRHEGEFPERRRPRSMDFLDRL